MLTQLVDRVLNLPPDVLGQWGYIIVFLFSIIESLPLIGLVIPGGVIVIASGFLVKLGILSFIPTLIVVSASAFLGDAIAYFLGRKYGYDFLVKLGKYIFVKEVHFEKAKKVLHLHPRKAILGGRFHALTRCVMPFAAGATGIRPSLFLPSAAFSCVVWALINIATGYVFGQGFQVASHYLGTIFFLAILLSILIIYSYGFISRFTEKNKQIIERYKIYPLLLNLVSISIVAKIIESVMVGSRVRRLDVVVNHFFQNIRIPFFDKLFEFITSLTTPTTLTVIGCILAAYFIYKKKWYFLSLLPASLISGLISFSILKRVTHVARPLFPLVPTSDYSFPSGHATLAIVFFGLVAYFFKDQIVNIIWRRIYVGGCVAAAVIVALSRLYLGAHWLSDVLAGTALGIFWITLYILLFHFFTSISAKRMEKEFDKEI